MPVGGHLVYSNIKLRSQQKRQTSKLNINVKGINKATSIVLIKVWGPFETMYL